MVRERERERERDLVAFTGIGGNSGEDSPDVGVRELDWLGGDLGGHGVNVVLGARRRRRRAVFVVVVVRVWRRG